MHLLYRVKIQGNKRTVRIFRTTLEQRTEEIQAFFSSEIAAVEEVRDLIVQSEIWLPTLSHTQRTQKIVQTFLPQCGRKTADPCCDVLDYVSNLSGYDGR